MPRELLGELVVVGDLVAVVGEFVVVGGVVMRLIGGEDEGLGSSPAGGTLDDIPPAVEEELPMTLSSCATTTGSITA